MDWHKQAAAIYARGGLDPANPVPAAKLVSAVIGPRSLRLLDPKSVRKEVTVARVGAGWRIYLKRGLPVARAELATLQGLAEWVLIQRGVGEDEISRDAPQLAKALFELAGGPKSVRKARTGKRRSRSKAG